ncbi:MAG: hypothetical protein Q8L98_08595 [Chlamydiales bacterium]|nr:hypothetical protein [Chlamydiales bacterium]
MIDLIQSYLNEETNDFCGLVGQLEGALDNSEIQDNVLINRWYDFWTPLEIRRVVQGNNIEQHKAIEELFKMKEFLLEVKNNEN